MILYHGGTDIIECPVCNMGRKHLDFGQGFYLTDIREQAERWARRQATDRSMTPVVNIYEFDYVKAIDSCRYLRFSAYDESWLDFIVGSRRGLRPWDEYDIVEGGVADDRIIDTVELYSLGILNKADALGRLSEHQPNNQICILNQAICNECLNFLESVTL